MELKKRLDLDLGFRLPERVILSFGDEILILTEPTFQHIEFVDSLNHPILQYSRNLLYYIRFDLEDLPELLEFLNCIPFQIYQHLIAFCHIYFEQDTEISDKILGYASGDLKGILKAKAIHAKEMKQRTIYDLLFNRLFEGLGVHVKAAPPKPDVADQTEEDEPPQDFAWIPLTQAINPKGFEAVRGKLVYQETGFEDLAKILNESEKLNEQEKMLKDPAKESQLQVELEKAEKKGRIPLSLVTSRAEYIQAIKQFAKFGYLEVSSKMDTKEYMKRVMEGHPELSKDRDRVKDHSQLAEQDQINIKSRWKGLKKKSEE